MTSDFLIAKNAKGAKDAKKKVLCSFAIFAPLAFFAIKK
jgi:hypothetical protein